MQYCWSPLAPCVGRRNSSAVMSAVLAMATMAVYINITVQCSAVQCSAVYCIAVQCRAMQCSAVHCSAVAAATMAMYINILTQNKEVNYNSVTLYVGVVRSYENKLGKSKPGQIAALKESALRPILSSSRDVSLSICPLFM